MLSVEHPGLSDSSFVTGQATPVVFLRIAVKVAGEFCLLPAGTVRLRQNSRVGLQSRVARCGLNDDRDIELAGNSNETSVDQTSRILGHYDGGNPELGRCSAAG